MYAAMPAVLKEAICRAYESCGWDLVRSIAPYNVFPTFEDVKRELSNYVNESEYSSDTKGDYKGALETRLQSLNSGLHRHCSPAAGPYKGTGLQSSSSCPFCVQT